jgi:hypothetical protein
MTNRNGMALLLCAAAAALTGCGVQPAKSATPGVIPQAAAPLTRARPARRAWMDGGVGQQDLLYVSNANGEVTVYRYWQHTLVGVLSDFTQPMGECVDKAGDVFITDSAAQRILEYAHGGTKPINTLDDSPDAPYACSVDQSTGDLAVANNDGSSKQGNIAIWAPASGQRINYTDAQLGNFVGCAYDDKGNLLVTNGHGYSSPAAFAWLPKNGAKLINVSVPGPKPSWHWYVGGVQWDGKYFALDDYSIYRVSLIHGQVYYVGTTALDSGGYSPYWIYNNNPSGQGTQVVGSNGSSVNYWQYPAGAEPIYSLTHGVDHPFAVTISLKNK